MPLHKAERGTVDAVRRFNRFYTRRLGLLKPQLLDSGLTLTESRLLYELAHGPDLTAATLARELQLDPGHLSRLLGGFVRRGWLRRRRSARDGRELALALSASGRAAFAALDRASHEQVARMVGPLQPAQAGQLVSALAVTERWLADGDTAASRDAASFTLRAHRCGDIGWIVHRQGLLYEQEYGYNIRFEALVAQIAARFVERFDPRQERCWIAERDGLPAGSVFVVRKSAQVAQLRLLYVEPWARGGGLGRRLVQECIAFARAAGYRRMVLWTQSELDAARHIYKASGFVLVRQEPHHSFGHDLIGEYWALKL